MQTPNFDKSTQWHAAKGRPGPSSSGHTENGQVKGKKRETPTAREQKVGSNGSVSKTRAGTRQRRKSMSARVLHSRVAEAGQNPTLFLPVVTCGSVEHGRVLAVRAGVPLYCPAAVVAMIESAAMSAAPEAASARLPAWLFGPEELWLPPVDASPED